MPKPETLREKATKLLEQAGETKDGKLRLLFLDLATQYAEMAARADVQAAAKQSALSESG